MCSKYEKLFVFSILLLIIALSFSCNKNPTTPSIQDMTKPVIWLDVFNISFVASETGPNPLAQTLKLKNTGQGALNYSISDDADWLTVSETSSTSTGQIKEHTVSVNKNSLTPKEEAYTAVITVSSSGAYNSPQKVNVRLTLSGESPPEIQVTPTNLSFHAQSGGADPAQKKISILNTGSGTLQFTVEPDASWISVNPSSGTSKDQQKKVSVSVQIAGLATGTYNGNILISDLDTTKNPQEVNISLTISEAGEAHPEIQVTPTNLNFNAQSGGADPAQKEIYILNTGSDTLQFSVEPDASWISVNPSSGTSKGQQKKVRVSVQTAGMATGTYNGNILVSDPNATNSPQKVKVNLTISEKSTPEIAINPKNITFQASQGDSNPSPAYMYVSNSGESTLNYSIDWNTNWLSVSPNTGQTEAAARKHTISANISGLSAGSYSATITVTDPEASNSPQTVNVTLTITASSVPTDNKVGISLSPSSGPTGTTVTIPISVKGNTSQISTFGIEMHFDTTMFAFQSVTSGTLTVSWGYMGGNDTGGTIIIGGARLAANPISIGSSGTIAIVKLKVTCSSCSNGNTSQITINNLSDDISGMTASPSSVTFTYTE